MKKCSVLGENVLDMKPFNLRPNNNKIKWKLPSPSPGKLQEANRKNKQENQNLTK